MDRKYLVVVENEDPIIVTVVEDVNRPNNPDQDTVLQDWITDNYGSRKHEYWELGSCETITI